MGGGQAPEFLHVTAESRSLRSAPQASVSDVHAEARRGSASLLRADVQVKYTLGLLRHWNVLCTYFFSWHMFSV